MISGNGFLWQDINWSESLHIGLFHHFGVFQKINDPKPVIASLSTRRYANAIPGFLTTSLKTLCRGAEEQ
ncbi:hypothetical protein, partial [uncultured Nostoc sp.]|uniref:hypothetical protein n=1 Tax=uncultured Nostoc sp. TaxID=340711 RepID=UPI0035CBA9D9